VDEIRITVPFDVGRLAPNRHLHWAERARIGKAAWYAGRYAWLMAGEPVSCVPVLVQITVRRPRRLDADNALSACKQLIDALLVRGITYDDSPDWVTFASVNQERCPKGQESVTFIITERDDAPTQLATRNPGTG
jgi:hypothetical protein